MTQRRNLIELARNPSVPILSASEQCALKRQGCTCRSKGYVISAGAVFGRAELCTCVRKCRRCLGTARLIEQGTSKNCREPAPSRLVALYNSMEIPAKYAHASIGEFRNFSGNGRAVISQVQSWINGATAGKAKSLVVSGSVGVGKTYLMAGIAMELIHRGISVRFVDFFQLLSSLRAAYSAGANDADVLAPLLAVDIMMIDELGKGRNSEWEQTILDSLIMGRYNAGKIIVASTNYPLYSDVRPAQSYHVDLEANRSSSFNPDVFEPLEARIGKRIFSRLVEMSVFVELTGEDFRRVGYRGAGEAFSPLKNS
jgi:DNA replication protein DnaC